MWGSWKSDDRRIEFILETAEGSNHEVLEVANFRIQEDYTAKPISSVFLKASRWQRWYFCFKQFIGKFSFHWSVKVLAITFGSIVNVVSMSWSHFGSLVISGEFLVSSSPITTKLEIVVGTDVLEFVVWLQHWLLDHHTWSLIMLAHWNYVNYETGWTCKCHLWPMWTWLIDRLVENETLLLSLIVIRDISLDWSDERYFFIQYLQAFFRFFLVVLMQVRGPNTTKSEGFWSELVQSWFGLGFCRPQINWPVHWLERETTRPRKSSSITHPIKPSFVILSPWSPTLRALSWPQCYRSPTNAEAIPVSVWTLLTATRRISES